MSRQTHTSFDHGSKARIVWSSFHWTLPVTPPWRPQRRRSGRSLGRCTPSWTTQVWASRTPWRTRWTSTPTAPSAFATTSFPCWIRRTLESNGSWWEAHGKGKRRGKYTLNMMWHGVTWYDQTRHVYAIRCPCSVFSTHLHSVSARNDNFQVWQAANAAGSDPFSEDWCCHYRSLRSPCLDLDGFGMTMLQLQPMVSQCFAGGSHSQHSLSIWSQLQRWSTSRWARDANQSSDLAPPWRRWMFDSPAGENNGNPWETHGKPHGKTGNWRKPLGKIRAVGGESSGTQPLFSSPTHLLVSQGCHMGGAECYHGKGE